MGLAGEVIGWIGDRLPHFAGFSGDLVDSEDVAGELVVLDPDLGVAAGVEEVDQWAPFFPDVAAVVATEDEDGGASLGLTVNEFDSDRCASARVIGADWSGCFQGSENAHGVESALCPALLPVDV